MIYGITEGMVMQRDNNNRCKILIKADEPIERLACFDEHDNDIKIDFTDNVLTGIPVGGPYRVRINDEVFNNIYVGDLWILAGQSNMEGNGILTDRDYNYKDDSQIRAFYMNDQWKEARNPLHHTGRAKDLVHTKIYHALDQPKGVGAGLGLSFAVKMFGYTEVPQGLIPCAHGGTIQEHWTPDTRDDGGDLSLYGAMYRRFQANGSHIRGVLWYQGCTDGENFREQYYTERCTYLFNCMRRDLSTLLPKGKILPIVQVQIGRQTDEFAQEGEEHDRCWTSIRRQQLEIGGSLDGIDTLAAITYRTDDHVHLTSDSQWNLGEKVAEAMFNLIAPGEAGLAGALPGIKIGKITLQPVPVYTDYTEIVIDILNCHGALKAVPRAMGFVLAKAPDCIETWRRPYDAYVEGSKIHVRFRMQPTDLCKFYLYYGYGCDPDCNITDSKGNPVPCFGPIRIEDYRDTWKEPVCPCELPDIWMPPELENN